MTSANPHSNDLFDGEETVKKMKEFLRRFLILSAVFAMGFVTAALILDNRFGAMKKAFEFPEAVNATSFSLEVQSK